MSLIDESYEQLNRFYEDPELNSLSTEELTSLLYSIILDLHDDGELEINEFLLIIPKLIKNQHFEAVQAIIDASTMINYVESLNQENGNSERHGRKK